jgi:ankyrin repeat protein
MLTRLVSLLLCSLLFLAVYAVPPRLAAAVRANDADALRLALAAEPELLNSREEGSLRTALMSAALAGSTRVVEALLELGADSTIPEKDGYTPMHGAGFQGRAGVAKALLKHGVPHERHTDGYWPIHRACWGG